MRAPLRSASSACLLLTLAALAGCSSSSSSASSGGPGAITVNGETVSLAQSSATREEASAVPADALSGAVAANNAFALDLYARQASASAASNVVMSPLSASIALTMTYAGAKGSTASQMATALHYGAGASSIFDGQNGLTQALASRGSDALAAATHDASENQEPAPDASNYTLQVVNSLWGEKTYTWNADFLDAMAKDYGTGVYQEDFIGNFDGARQTINAWVSTETVDKINNLLPTGSLDSGTRLVLVNAVHLKFPWLSPFQVGATAPGTFIPYGGSSVTTPFMSQSAEFPYVDDGNAQIVAMPTYNNQLAVVIALPHGDLATYEAGLTASSAAFAVPSGTTEVALSLPKSSFTSDSISLKSSLQAMGMTDAFDKAKADFSGLVTPADGANLYIDDVLQKAMIAIDETGVEAAAATAVIAETDAVASDPVVVNVNHPYLISIIDVPTGAVLFVGHIVDPTLTGSE